MLVSKAALIHIIIGCSLSLSLSLARYHQAAARGDSSDSL